MLSSLQRKSLNQSVNEIEDSYPVQQLVVVKPSAW